MRTRSPSPSIDAGRGTDREHRVVLEHLDRWESKSLLPHDEAEAIRAFEHDEVAEAPRVPLIAEVVAYLGAALALGAGVALVGPRWEDITHAQRLTGAAVICAVLLLAGGWLRASDEPVVRRLAGVLWTLSVAALAGLVALLVFDLPAGREPAHWATFALGFSAAAYAAILRALRPCTPLVAALYAATLTAIGGAGVWAIREGWTWLDQHPAWFGTAMVLLSAAWIAAGAAGILEPKWAALTIGAIGAVFAPQTAFEPIGYGLLLGVGVAIALLAASTVFRNVAMLALGAIGLFGYLVGAIVHFLGDSIGVPLALLLCGLVLLAVSVVVARLRRFTVPSARGDVPV